jgi:hypothetical protein
MPALLNKCRIVLGRLGRSSVLCRTWPDHRPARPPPAVRDRADSLFFIRHMRRAEDNCASFRERAGFREKNRIHSARFLRLRVWLDGSGRHAISVEPLGMGAGHVVVGEDHGRQSRGTSGRRRSSAEDRHPGELLSGLPASRCILMNESISSGSTIGACN